jgi:hypothetical protein
MKNSRKFISEIQGIEDISIDQKILMMKEREDRIQRIEERNLKIGLFLSIGLLIGLIYLILFN